MWELNCEKDWELKNWCFWTVVLEKSLESPLDCKEIQSVHPKGGQSWVFIGRTDVEAETPILWPPVKKSWLIWKAPNAGKDWGQEEKGTTEDEMAKFVSSQKGPHRILARIWSKKGSLSMGSWNIFGRTSLRILPSHQCDSEFCQLGKAMVPSFLIKPWSMCYCESMLYLRFTFTII